MGVERKSLGYRAKLALKVGVVYSADMAVRRLGPRDIAQFIRLGASVFT